MLSIPNQVLVRGLVLTLVLVGASYAAYQFGYQRGLGMSSLSQARDGQPASTETRMLFGTVGSISGNEIALKDVKRIPGVASGQNVQSASVVVTIGQTTVVERLIQKSAALISAELSAYSRSLKKELSTSTASAVPPEPFTRQAISLSNVKVGDYVVVISDQDISTLNAFTATRIEVQDKPFVPTTVTTATSTAATKVKPGELPPPPLPAGAVKPK